MLAPSMVMSIAPTGFGTLGELQPAVQLAVVRVRQRRRRQAALVGMDEPLELDAVDVAGEVAAVAQRQRLGEDVGRRQDVDLPLIGALPVGRNLQALDPDDVQAHRQRVERDVVVEGQGHEAGALGEAGGERRGEADDLERLGNAVVVLVLQAEQEVVVDLAVALEGADEVEYRQPGRRMDAGLEMAALLVEVEVEPLRIARQPVERSRSPGPSCS